jgi:hypothetical protein
MVNSILASVGRPKAFLSQTLAEVVNMEIVTPFFQYILNTKTLLRQTTSDS